MGSLMLTAQKTLLLLALFGSARSIDSCSFNLAKSCQMNPCNWEDPSIWTNCSTFGWPQNSVDVTMREGGKHDRPYKIQFSPNYSKELGLGNIVIGSTNPDRDDSSRSIKYLSEVYFVNTSLSFDGDNSMIQSNGHMIMDLGENGHFRGNLDIKNNGKMTWMSGSIEDKKPIQIDEKGIMQISTSKLKTLHRSIENRGTIIINSDEISMRGASTIKNLKNGVMRMENSIISGSNSIINEGTIIIEDDSTSTIIASIDASGNVIINSRGIMYSERFSSNGTVIVKGKANFKLCSFSGDLRILGTSIFNSMCQFSSRIDLSKNGVVVNEKDSVMVMMDNSSVSSSDSTGNIINRGIIQGDLKLNGVRLINNGKIVGKVIDVEQKALGLMDDSKISAEFTRDSSVNFLIDKPDQSDFVAVQCGGKVLLGGDAQISIQEAITSPVVLLRGYPIQNTFERIIFDSLDLCPNPSLSYSQTEVTLEC